MEDGNHNYTGYRLDAWGRIREIRKADGSTEEYGYDCAGNLISSTDGEGHTTRYSYDGEGNLVTLVDALGGKEEYVYDEEGRLKEKRDRNGITTEYGYTLYGAPLYRRVKGSEEGDFYRYTPEGLLRSALSQRREGSMCYRYGYDGNGNRIRQRDVTGKVTEYVYDVCDRLTEVWEEGRKLASYTYGADGRIREESHGPMRKEYAYDGQKNLTGLTLWSGDRLLTDNQYRYDGNGNCIVKKQLSGETRYSFDRLNQLKRVDYPAYREELFYDKAGNRTRRLVEGAEERYGYDAGNRLTGYTRKGVTISFVYDGAGNLLRDNRAEYSYDGFNRTVRVDTFDGHIQVNRYDAEGLRHELEENGKLVQFIFNPERQVVTETGAEKIRYIRGRELIASDAESARTYYHYASNELGSITHLLDESGAILNRYEYDAWGNLVECEERVANRFAFAGEQLDPLTQQYYLRARYYNPVMGRFTQEDSYRGDGLNLYTYCRNNPVYYVDPSGHMANCQKEAYEKYRKEGMPEAEAYEKATGKNPLKEKSGKVADGSEVIRIVQELKKEQIGKRLGVDPAENREKAPEAETPQSESGTASDELIHVYRGTDKYAELSAYEQTGHLMSDATRNIYMETGNLSAAYKQTGAVHNSWLKVWGNEVDYAQAHGAFGTELSQAFGLDRTLMSVTTDPNIARGFAGNKGRVFEAYIPKSQLIKQTLSGAGESEYLIRFGSGGFR